jgi:hypothetical protein
MSDAHTKKMLREYVEQAPAPMFLSGFFRSPPENFHTTESVELDVERDGEDVAIVVQDLSVGGRKNESSLYTNKEFTPPIFKEEATIPAHKLLSREPGQHSNMEPVYSANALRRTSRVMRKMDAKIRRSIELQASQVFQTGSVTLTDSDGTSLFTLDYQAKAAHMATVGTTWGTDGSTGDPLADLASLLRTVRRNGKVRPTRAIFGESALQRLLANDDVKARLDNRRFELGEIAPAPAGADSAYRYGVLWVDTYPIEIWRYDADYIAPETGDLTPYVSDNNVIILGDSRLDLTYGAVPRIGAPDPRALPFLPARLSGPGAGIDIHPNAWLSNDGQAVHLSVAARPLCIPTAIDTFARLTVVA